METPFYLIFQFTIYFLWTTRQTLLQQLSLLFSWQLAHKDLKSVGGHGLLTNDLMCGFSRKKDVTNRFSKNIFVTRHYTNARIDIASCKNELRVRNASTSNIRVPSPIRELSLD